jgi:pyruvate dehydrogenase E2 component (dihydrolipoamide acetyltransferase)
VATDFKLPELGENITSGDVLRVLIKPGDTLARDQPVLELETDKATIEVPSPVAGQVRAVRVKAGDKIKVGQVILSLDEAADGDGAKKAEPAAAASAADEQPSGSDEQAEPEPSGSPAAVGEEPAATAPATRPRDRKVVNIGRPARPPAARAEPAAPAAPSVRRMARELGVDIDQVPGSGPDGRISIEDVKEQARRIVSAAGTAKGGHAAAEPLPDFSRWGEVDRQPMRAVRRKTAEHLAAAWAAVPHVTQHDVADITQLDELRKRYAKKAEALGGSLTMTAIAAKVAASALKLFPQVNSSIDLAAEEIVYKKYVHIGIAVDTDRGLLVPVVRDVDRKSILQLSVEIAQLSEKARNRKISLDEMQGGCFSVSNLGGIGGTAFTPIVNLPEVAILGISRARMEPIHSKETGQFVPRLMLPMSLSYDHRVVDGAEGIRFLRWIVEAMEQPFLLALEA